MDGKRGGKRAKHTKKNGWQEERQNFLAPFASPLAFIFFLCLVLFFSCSPLVMWIFFVLCLFLLSLFFSFSCSHLSFFLLSCFGFSLAFLFFVYLSFALCFSCSPPSLCKEDTMICFSKYFTFKSPKKKKKFTFKS